MTRQAAEQLQLIPPPVKLSDRQQRAYELVTGAYTDGQTVSNERLGAFLHEYRQSKGGKGHGRDETCDYCHQEGSQMGHALRSKGLVRYSRKNETWLPADTTEIQQPARLADRGEFPAGF